MFCKSLKDSQYTENVFINSRIVQSLYIVIIINIIIINNTSNVI